MMRVVPFLSGVYFWTLYLLWEREREISIFQLKNDRYQQQHSDILILLLLQMYRFRWCTQWFFEIWISHKWASPQSRQAHIYFIIIVVVVVVVTQINVANASKKNWKYQKFDLRFTFAEYKNGNWWCWKFHESEIKNQEWKKDEFSTMIIMRNVRRPN